tara:strand:+ start:33 stop:263 length:231 start_codon:yes stop_codon:yes gene_type:complete
MKLTKTKLKEIIREEIMNKEKLTEASAKVTVGFSNEMGALYLSARGDTGGNKSIELRKADVEAIIKQYKKFKSKMD